MKIEIYNLTPEQAEKILAENSPKESLPAIQEISSVTEVFLLARYGNEELCVFGLVPETILGDIAHLWVQDFPAIMSHRVIFARESRKVIQNLLNLYSTIVGFCTTRSAMQWLQWVGAEFGPPVNNAIPFTFRRIQ